MRINLQEIGQDGRSYDLSEATGELNEALASRLGKMAYSLKFSLRPTLSGGGPGAQSGTFTLAGSIETKIPEDCALCGENFPFPLKEKFSHILIPATAMQMPRNGHTHHTNHISDLQLDGPEALEYEGHHFDVGAFAHEALGLAEPFAPTPKFSADNKCMHCGLTRESVCARWQTPEIAARLLPDETPRASASEKPVSTRRPFSALGHLLEEAPPTPRTSAEPSPSQPVKASKAAKSRPKGPSQPEGEV